MISMLLQSSICRRHLLRLESLLGTFVGVVDFEKGGADVHIYGLCESITIVLHVLECFSEGVYSVLSSIERAFGVLDLGWKGKGFVLT